MTPDGGGSGKSDFYRILTEAVAEFSTRGYTSQDELDNWMQRIRQAALACLVPEKVLEQELRGALAAAYRREVEKGGILRFHPTVPTYNLERIKPKLRPELDRRIMASARLIKLNREQTIEITLRRFSGWATSIPAGGSPSVDRVDTKKHIRKALASLPFEERRVAIDQAAKLVSAISEIVATDNGAIAAEWRSNYRQAGYDYRDDHKERAVDGTRTRVYLVRGTWAIQRRLVKAGPDGFTDQFTQPGEEVFCQCRWHWLYDLDQLPSNMLTDAGKRAIKLP